LCILSFSMPSPTSLNPSSQALATTHIHLPHSCFCKFVLILVAWRQCKNINTHLHNTIKAHKTTKFMQWTLPCRLKKNCSIKLPQFSSSKIRQSSVTPLSLSFSKKEMQNPNSYFHAKSSFLKIPNHKFPIYSTFGFSRTCLFHVNNLKL
jgi:hypothetical protein